MDKTGGTTMTCKDSSEDNIERNWTQGTQTQKYPVFNIVEQFFPTEKFPGQSWDLMIDRHQRHH